MKRHKKMIHAGRHSLSYATVCGLVFLTYHVQQIDCVDCMGWHGVTCKRCRKGKP